MAENRHADAVAACLLLGDERTWLGRGSKSENDPEPTLMQWQTRRPSAGHRLREGSAGVAALHLGQHEGDELRYIGKVGTGFTRKSSIENRRKLDAITTAKSPLTKPVRTLKLRGSSRNMWRTWNTATALRKATSGIARSRACARIVESRPDALRSSPRS